MRRLATATGTGDLPRRLPRLAVVGALLVSSVWLVIFSPAPAQAARPVVYISTPGVSSVWPVSQAVAFMNRHTGSKLVRGRCQASAPCVVITESANLGLPNTMAITYPTFGSAAHGQRAFRTSIELGLHARRQSARARQATLVHELGHAFGLWRHNPSCASVMYHSTRCNTLKFTASERAILRRN